MSKGNFKKYIIHNKMSYILSKTALVCLFYLGGFGLVNANVSVPTTLPATLPNHQGHITLQPNINLPLITDTQNRQDVANQCSNNCCIYNNVFYSEGSVIVIGDAILLQCSRDPNVSGANSLRWMRLDN
ncbi:DUF1496 domain-containing protein [Thorsellia anophelis]|uniref:DUF1496 domain-containing protein n=1 Tax=Thorsellia anophelis DSM 18579 TaxID=1123402 RepID=A0A1I0EIP2_9GAMM|nr:DUF1496 domain-containing protein [Thorsellia anophelis]SET45011.1 Protein of unknown function [Thorsellia anophelis DSM 18579]